MFGADFRTAQLDDGTVRFTVAESRLLAFLSRHPEQTLTRDQILDAISDNGSEKSDRSVDFLINRVRRKLGDNARQPRFIETRYGGGYVWLGRGLEAPAADTADVEAVAVVGPLKGLDLLGPYRETGLAFAQTLAAALAAEIGSPVTVKPAMEASSGPGLQPGSGITRFSVELLFFRDGVHCRCVIAARSHLSGQVFYVERLALTQETAPYRANTRAVGALAPAILAARWRQDTDHFATRKPLAVAMNNASLETESTRGSWREIDPILTKLRKDHPDDPAIALTYASHLHTNVVIHGMDLLSEGFEACIAIDREIETLARDALGWCQDKPAQAMIAAKLLYYVDRGYKALALELAEQAHAKSTSIASSLAIFGQLRTFTGDIDAGVSLLRQAEALTEPGSRFRHYVQVFLCQALIADGRREELGPVRDEVYDYDPVVRVLYELCMTEPDTPSLRAKGAMQAMSKARATALLRFQHHISARLYEQPKHRANTLRTPVSLAVHRFGRDVVPAELVEATPALFG